MSKWFKPRSVWVAPTTLYTLLAILICGWLATEAGSRPARSRSARLSESREIGDDDERQERLDLGRRSFQDNCLMCHADDIAAGQRLTAQQWVTVVDKMIGWGAPVPADQKSDLL